ncbi:hypothetical protein [Pseudogulbenkiania ferrooxidans]|uniref:Uncharacterized protein n=1 Tax=Pseudogulbenkiania ferrooxidans 2002 TaxID=279714 RepID=B9Z4W0_9NEIS|nr:hypothetical protein [Pseudogulbenkiania ferrooxidans]EEG08192.1 hypothetical protein FuraDRAFT_2395 [Pseudogulbenkiania ferrooxidans 2002]
MPHPATLTFEQFAALTPAERLDHLKGYPIITESQGFLDGTKRVGEAGAVITKHRALVRGIPIGGWYTTPAVAIDAARDFLEDWDGEL